MFSQLTWPIQHKDTLQHASSPIHKNTRCRTHNEKVRFVGVLGSLSAKSCMQCSLLHTVLYEPTL